MSDELLKAALNYGKMGWAVFPCHGVTKGGECTCHYGSECTATAKHPRIKDVFNLATSKEFQIRQWWKRWPTANIGLACGEISGLWALDIDPRHGGDDSLHEEEKRNGKLPDTVLAITGGGGQHYLFKHPGDGLRIRNKTNVGPGIDVRGDGGYIIVEPSMHASGRRYYWEALFSPEDQELAEAPEWLLRHVVEVEKEGTPKDVELPTEDTTATPEALEKLEEFCGWLKKAGDGERHSARKSAGYWAGRLIGGGLVSTAEALSVLEEAAQSNSTERPDKIRSTLLDMMRHGFTRPWEPPKAQNIPPPPTDDDMPPELRGADEGGPARHLELVRDEGPPPDDPEELPAIFVSNRQDRDIVADAWRAIHRSNNPPRIFRRGDGLTRIFHNGNRLHMQLMAEGSTYGELIRCATWLKNGRGGTFAARPSKQVCRDLFVNPSPRLPELDEIVGSPVFSEQKEIIATEGYHKDSRIFLHMPGFQCPTIPKSPTDDELAQAKSLILDELFHDFEFASISDQTHAVAGLLLPFVRRLISGPTPLHSIEASTPGTGKTLLANIMHLIGQGRPVEATPMTRDEEEMRKKITSLLMRGQPVILFDNVNSKVRLGSFASLLTSTHWEDRQLGTNAMLRLPNRSTWFITANNPEFSPDITRRIIRIRIESKWERPWKRSGFKHDPLAIWVTENRKQLVWACLVIVQRWIASGAHKGSQKPPGSFEEWGQTIGGIFDATGFIGFLGNVDEVYEASDTESSEWRAFVALWWDRYQSNRIAANDLKDLALNNEMLLGVIGDKSERSQSQRFSKALERKRGRIFGGYQIVDGGKDSHSRRKLWMIEPTEELGSCV